MSGSTIIGFDFGAHTCRLTALNPTKRMPVKILNSLSNESTPSVVSFTAGKFRESGEGAAGLMHLSSSSSVTKAAMYGIDTEAQGQATQHTFHSTGTCVALDAEDKCFVFEFGDTERYHPTQLAALLLKRLVNLWGGAPVSRVCISYPPTADETFKKSLVAAARVAGIDADKVQIAPDDIAAAVYMHHLHFSALPKAKESEALEEGEKEATEASCVVIVNVGYSHSSIAVVSARQNSVDILSRRSIRMGSEAIDRAITQHVLADVKAKKKVDLASHAKSFVRLMREAEKCKKMLSSVDKSTMNVEGLKDDTDVSATLTRAEMEGLSSEFVAAFREMCAQAKEDAKAALAAAGGEVRIEAIGNGWRTPILQHTLVTVFGASRVGVALDGNQAVAEGCAILAAKCQHEMTFAGIHTSEDKYEEKQQKPEGEKDVNDPTSPMTPATPPCSPVLSVDAIHGVNITVAGHPYSTLAEGGDSSTFAVVSFSSAEEERINSFSKTEQTLSGADTVIQERLSALDQLESCTLQMSDMRNNIAADAAAVEALKALVDEYQQKYEDYSCMLDDENPPSADAIRKTKAEFQEKIKAQVPQVQAFLDKQAEITRAKEAELEQMHKEQEGLEKELKTDPQRLRAAQQRREQGQALFKQEHYQEAQTRFVQSLAYLNQIYDTKDADTIAKKNEIALSCHLNVASCSVKLKLWRNALNNCDRALEIDKDNVKALFRRGQARSQLHQNEEAKLDLQQALALKDDPGIAAELKAVEDRIQAEKNKEKALFSKMFA